MFSCVRDDSAIVTAVIKGFHPESQRHFSQILVNWSDEGVISDTGGRVHQVKGTGQFCTIIHTDTLASNFIDDIHKQQNMNMDIAYQGVVILEPQYTGLKALGHSAQANTICPHITFGLQLYK